MRFLLTGLILASFQSVFAFQPLRVRVNPGDRIQIKGHRGSISYVVVPGARDLSVEVDEPNLKGIPNGEEWQFGFRRENSGLILLQVDSPLSKSAWSSLMMSGDENIPAFNIKLVGPSIPMQINWHNGSIEFKNYSESIEITQVKGSVFISGGEGDVHVAQQEGLVQITDRKGSVNVDCYNASIDIGGIEGDLKLENFIGETNVKVVQGATTITSFKGKTKLAKLNGRLNFTNGVSPLYIEQFEGELRGKSLQGPVHASILGEANVRVESQDGAVNLKLAGSGAYVNAGTAEGSLQVPQFLRLTRLPSQQIRTGRLRGNLGGSVFVRTTTGNIQIR